MHDIFKVVDEESKREAAERRNTEMIEHAVFNVSISATTCPEDDEDCSIYK